MHACIVAKAARFGKFTERDDEIIDFFAGMLPPLSQAPALNRRVNSSVNVCSILSIIRAARCMSASGMHKFITIDTPLEALI